MKRYGNLYPQICSFENLELAFYNASKKKHDRQDVQEFADKLESNLLSLQKELVSHTYRTSEYVKEIIFEPKEREIFKLPFRDRVVHWAIMNVIERIWHSGFTSDTYACMPKRGIHLCAKRVKKALRDNPEETKYCLKLDVEKFYPSIDHDILKGIIRRKIKDPYLLRLLDEIIDTAEGVPIGNYLSQYFANIYLSELDHKLKEEVQVTFYFRYMDDLVILGPNKALLRSHLVYINHYLHEHRNIRVKRNYQIFPIDDGSENPRGLDFVGYKFFHTHTLLRKSIKKNLCRVMASVKKQPHLTEQQKKQKLASHYGWAKFANSNHLLKVIGMSEIKKFDPARYKPKPDPDRKKKPFMDGTKIHVSDIFGRNIKLLAWAEEPSQYEGLRIKLHFEVEEDVPQPEGGSKKELVRHISFFWSENVYDILRGIDETEEDPYPMMMKFITQEITRGGKKGVQYSLAPPDE